MKTVLSVACVFFILCGCETGPVSKLFPPEPNTAENRRDWWDRSLGQRDGRRGYRVPVEVSDAGCHIEINDELVATLTNRVGEIIVWAHDDGQIHESRLVIVANPVLPGQFQQRKVFLEHDRVPRRLYFDLRLAAPTNGPGPQNVNINANINRH